MRDQLDMDALLKRVAEEDNAALPFAQWKAALLEKAADTEGSAPSEFELYRAHHEEKKPNRKKLYRISGAIAGVAAAFVIMLSINANTAGGAIPAPADSGAAQQFAMEESAMDSAEAEQGNPSAFSAPLPSEAPQASASSRSGGLGNNVGGYAGGAAADEAPMPEAAELAPMMLDPNFDAAISAVKEALADNAADHVQAKAAPTAVAEYESTYSITPLGGGEAYTLELPLAYVVSYTDGKHYIVRLLEPEGMEVLGTIDRY